MLIVIGFGLEMCSMSYIWTLKKEEVGFNGEHSYKVGIPDIFGKEPSLNLLTF